MAEAALWVSRPIRDRAKDLQLQISAGVGRRLTMQEFIGAILRYGVTHQTEIVEFINDEKPESRESQKIIGSA